MKVSQDKLLKHTKKHTASPLSTENSESDCLNQNLIGFDHSRTLCSSKDYRLLLKAENPILSELLSASCFHGLSLDPVSWSSLCHISPSCPNTWPEQYSYGSRSNWEDGQGDRWKPKPISHSFWISQSNDSPLITVSRVFMVQPSQKKNITSEKSRLERRRSSGSVTEG